jgi:phosphatidylglycerol---prolipoprotein diacylglyceryl transferase
MTFPVWIAVGPLRVHPHLVFELVAYLVGIALYQQVRARRGDHVSTHDRWALFAAAAAGAVVGSRLLNWLEDPAAAVRRSADVVTLIGGQTIVGGLLGAWIAVEIQKRRIGITSSTGDLLAVPAAAAFAVGRIGCFLSGLPDGTYGLATSLPWGIDLGDGVPRHPTALYESLFLVALAAALWRYQDRRTNSSARPGLTFKLFVASYLTFRLFVDALKPGIALALGLTAIQWACLGGLAYYAWQFAGQRRTAVRSALHS